MPPKLRLGTSNRFSRNTKRPVRSLPLREAPHRPGTAPALGLRAGGNVSSMLTQTASSLRGDFVMSKRSLTRRLNLEFLENRCLLSTFAAFDLAAPENGPFPSDRFTVADSSQLTNRRVNLPLPDAASRPSDYADLTLLNTLDGFNVQPRLSVAFSGPIDVSTASSHNIFLIKLADTTAPEELGGRIVGINQIVWDVATNTLHVES